MLNYQRDPEGSFQGGLTGWSRWSPRCFQGDRQLQRDRKAGKASWRGDIHRGDDWREAKHGMNMRMMRIRIRMRTRTRTRMMMMMNQWWWWWQLPRMVMACITLAGDHPHTVPDWQCLGRCHGRAKGRADLPGCIQVATPISLSLGGKWWSSIKCFGIFGRPSFRETGHNRTNRTNRTKYPLVI